MGIVGSWRNDGRMVCGLHRKAKRPLSIIYWDGIEGHGS
jgi:hypothetical protein